MVFEETEAMKEVRESISKGESYLNKTAKKIPDRVRSILLGLHKAEYTVADVELMGVQSGKLRSYFNVVCMWSSPDSIFGIAERYGEVCLGLKLVGDGVEELFSAVRQAQDERGRLAYALWVYPDTKKGARKAETQVKHMKDYAYVLDALQLGREYMWKLIAQQDKGDGTAELLWEGA